jgi:aryl-alcohol dehydrogenase-like predicted oxidoreductase
MTALSRLGLGTVQFGMDYGVSNRKGRPDQNGVAGILGRAVEANIGYVDTSPAYGEAETLLGRHLPAGHRLRVVTKTPPIPEERIEARHFQLLLDSTAISLERLRTDSIHGLLVHRVGDLAKPGWQHIVDALIEVRARGWVNAIGASIYNPNELDLIESCFRPQIVQLPLNVLDRRPIASGMLTRLKRTQTEIHVRSVFLQGLLLMDPNEVPSHFAAVRPDIIAMHQFWHTHGLSAVAGCLAFALRQAEVDAIIVGVNSPAELDEIISAVAHGLRVDEEGPAPLVDPIYLDPSRWRTVTH